MLLSLPGGMAESCGWIDHGTVFLLVSQAERPRIILPSREVHPDMDWSKAS